MGERRKADSKWRNWFLQKSAVSHEDPRFSVVFYEKKKGMAAVLSESVLDLNGPKWSSEPDFSTRETKMDQSFGPFGSANRTLAIPEKIGKGGGTYKKCALQNQLWESAIGLVCARTL